MSSEIYKYFESGVILDADKETESSKCSTKQILSYLCKICKNKKKTKTVYIKCQIGVSSNLYKHLNSKDEDHVEAVASLQQLNINKKNNSKRTLVFDAELSPSTPISKQCKLEQSISITKKYNRFNPIQELRTNDLTTMLIKCCLPISLVEHQAFRHFLNQLDPSYRPPCRYTLKSTHIPHMVDQIFFKMKKIIQTVEYPNISADGWSDAILRSFNGYNLQGIDKNWNLHKIPISFNRIKGKK
jgi:hypothetical protein